MASTHPLPPLNVALVAWSSALARVIQLSLGAARGVPIWLSPSLDLLALQKSHSASLFPSPSRVAIRDVKLAHPGAASCSSREPW